MPHLLFNLSHNLNIIGYTMTSAVNSTPVLSLKSLLVASKATTVDYPGFENFTIDVCFLARETIISLKTKATTKKYVNRVLTETIDDDLFLKLWVSEAIKGWKGLKLAYVNMLAPIEMDGINPEDELQFTTDNALFLVKSSVEFDGYISSIVNDLSAFTKASGNK
jgi:hypothetical protein